MSFIFLYGQPGSGKTTLAASMTKLGYKVRFIDVDDKVRLMQNLQGGIKKDNIRITPILSKLTETTMKEAIMSPQIGLIRQPQGYLEICDIITKYEEMFARDESPTEQVLVKDSLTSQIEHMKRLIAHIQGKAHFTYDEWAIVLSNLEEYFYTMKGLLETASVTYPESINELTGEKIPGSVIPGHPGFKHIIIIAHETTERDETTGKVQTLPFIEGQMRHKVGKYFEEVYHCQVDVPKTGKPIYKVLTVSTDRYSARTSRELPVFVSSDFSVILGKAEGKAKGEALDPIQAKVEAAKKAKEGKK